MTLRSALPVLLAALLLSACSGWQLRGQTSVPNLESVTVDGASARLRYTLEDRLEPAGVQVHGQAPISSRSWMSAGTGAPPPWTTGAGPPSASCATRSPGSWWTGTPAPCSTRRAASPPSAASPTPGQRHRHLRRGGPGAHRPVRGRWLPADQSARQRLPQNRALIRHASARRATGQAPSRGPAAGLSGGRRRTPAAGRGHGRGTRRRPRTGLR